uniref:Secreted protein n=1 Tax=Ixodes ricinus TaxID=34613 RepID=A0A6B0UGH5_IXORI
MLLAVHLVGLLVWGWRFLRQCCVLPRGAFTPAAGLLGGSAADWSRGVVLFRGVRDGMATGGCASLFWFSFGVRLVVFSAAFWSGGLCGAGIVDACCPG